MASALFCACSAQGSVAEWVGVETGAASIVGGPDLSQCPLPYVLTYLLAGLQPVGLLIFFSSLLFACFLFRRLLPCLCCIFCVLVWVPVSSRDSLLLLFILVPCFLFDFLRERHRVSPCDRFST